MTREDRRPGKSAVCPSGSLNDRRWEKLFSSLWVCRRMTLHRLNCTITGWREGGKRRLLQSRILEEGLALFYPEVRHNSDAGLPFKVVVVIVSVRDPLWQTVAHWITGTAQISLCHCPVVMLVQLMEDTGAVGMNTSTPGSPVQKGYIAHFRDEGLHQNEDLKHPRVRWGGSLWLVQWVVVVKSYCGPNCTRLWWG